MHCTKCGAELLNGAKFCTGCGAPVKIIPVNNTVPAGNSVPVNSSVSTGNATSFKSAPTGSASGAGNGASQNTAPEKKQPPKKKEDRGFRIGMSVLLSFLAVIAFGFFFYFLSAKTVFSYNYRQAFNERVDLEKMIVEKLAEAVGGDVIDPNSSLAGAISDIAENELGVSIEEETIEKVLDNPELLSSFMGYAADVSQDMASGDIDVNAMAQGFLSVIEQNRDVLEEVTGVEFTDEELSQMHDALDAIEDPVNQIQDQIEEISGTGSEENGTTVDSESAEPETEEIETVGSETTESAPVYEIEREEVYTAESLKKMEEMRQFQDFITGKITGASFIYSNYTLYGSLILGLIFLALIMVLNRKIISSGFRGCGIVCIVTGVINCCGGLVVMLISKGTSLLGDFVMDKLSAFEDIGDAIFEIALDVLGKVSRGILIAALSFLIVGIGLMIASGVTLSADRKRLAENK